MGFSGAFAFSEPGPYEAVAVIAIIAFLPGGLVLGPALAPLFLLLLFYNIGIFASVMPILHQERVFQWALITCYLSGTALFFAALSARNTQERLRRVVSGFVWGAVVASLAAIIGYFIGSELLTRYGRARGTFNDPNVLGAFLVFPALVSLQYVLTERLPKAVWGALLLSVVASALLLTFSRGAWTQFMLAALLLMVLSFVIHRSSTERARIILVGLFALLAIAIFLALLLSIGKVAELFEIRARLDQSYDVGQIGRFGRYILGMMLVFDNPLGIGPLQFGRIFSAAPHNAYLNAFVIGGWLSGICYITLVAVTLGVGFRFVFVSAPWQKYYVVAYAAFAGLAAESLVIDSDHWRHYFLLLGIIWGLIAASRFRTRTHRSKCE